MSIFFLCELSKCPQSVRGSNATLSSSGTGVSPPNTVCGVGMAKAGDPRAVSQGKGELYDANSIRGHSSPKHSTAFVRKVRIFAILEDWGEPSRVNFQRGRCVCLVQVLWCIRS